MKAIRYAVRSYLGCYPLLYFPLLHLVRSPRRHLHVRRDTGIVIEGYPRSANTFAVAAFQFAQGRPMKIARHVHVPAQIIQAVRWGIPTLVLIRNPEDAVLSLLIREPYITAHQALKDYIRFYKRIEPYRSKFVLATFDDVTSDFGNVITKINGRFGTSFKPFLHTPENTVKVMQIVEEMDKADQGGVSVTETTVARPSKRRERLKQERRKELGGPGLLKLLEQATKIYYEAIER